MNAIFSILYMLVVLLLTAVADKQEFSLRLPGAACSADDDAETALFEKMVEAIEAGDTAKVAAVLEEDRKLGGVLTAEDKGTFLHIALELKDFETIRPILEQLLEAGADINMQLDEGETILITAVADFTDAELRHKLVPFILQHHPDLEIQEIEIGATALMYGAHDAEVVKMLIEAGADVNACSSEYDCSTPLMHAAEAGCAESVRLLLAAGADPHAKDDEGKTALDYAFSDIRRTSSKRDYAECARLLQAAMQK